MKTVSRGAASSIASGIPSRRAIISATTAALASVRAKLGSTERARSVKSRTASVSGDLLEGCGRIWDRQWWDREHLLAAHPQRLSARHQGDQAGTVLEQLGDPGGGLGHLLEVVEDQQPLAVTELCLEDLEGGSLAGAGQVHLPGDRLERTVGLTLRRQVDEEDAVPVPLYQVGTHLQGEPGLAGPSWPGQRDQPCPRLGHHRPDRSQLLLPAEELGHLRRGGCWAGRRATPVGGRSRRRPGGTVDTGARAR